MKKLFGALMILILAARLSAQSNEPVRLALISESDEASTASDILTAQLSGNPKIQLLERNEIEKIYHEQGLSAGNKDYLKLGQILGADGLLLFDVVRTKQATNLMTRLIAVKPGVVLTDGSFPWPLKDATSWAESATTYLNSFLPKLTVLVKDAIPISVVNLRSAVQSADAQETERQLKLLTIQRLSQERQFFVLERQRMQLLGEEKELKADESAFWNGNYLLEGVVDQNGYSKETVTINAQLTPPKGGTPLLFEVSGNRTNLSEVINQLAAKVNEALKVNPTVPEWNAADEAAQYFDEAKWALKWGVYSEAQAAADSAWALGKRDLDCAIVRIRAYETPLHSSVYQNGEFTNPDNTNRVIQVAVEEAAPNRPWGLTLHEQICGGTKVVQYVFADKFPDPKSIEVATHALELYYQFSRNSPEGLLKTASAESGWTNSEWYNLGVEDLVAASIVLQNFNFVPESQKIVADKLAELRALSRSVADWILQSPPVHDSYFVGDRIATHDELANTIDEDDGRNPNIFSCEAKWGCFWQERPEDCVALYRELMSSPVFSYIHKGFWIRELQTPRFIAWNTEDRRHIPMVWDGFVRELDTSTNVLLRLEAKAVQFADENDEKKMAAACTNLFDAIFDNRDALVANNVEVLYLDWGTGDLVRAKTGNGIASDIKSSLQTLFYDEYYPKLEAMDREYRQTASRRMATKSDLTAFEKQKQYLKENRPYDFFEFVHTFLEGMPNYSKAQALEIQPLLATYKSNLVTQSENASGMQKGQLMGAIAQVGFLENNVNRILNPPAPKPKIGVPQNTPPSPAPITQLKAVPTIPGEPLEVVTNTLLIKNCLKLPLERFGVTNISSTVIFVYRWSEGKLLQGFLRDNYYDGKPAVAIFNPRTGDWQMIECPEDYYHSGNWFIEANRIGLSLELFQGELYLKVGSQIQKYDSNTKQWEVLNVPAKISSVLFAINGRLFVVSDESIFEITDGGKGTHILASTRRRPAASALDSLDSLGSPILFLGTNNSVCTSIGNKVFNWNGNDWHELFTLNFSQPPEVFQDTIIFRSIGDPANLWIWEKNQFAPELALSDGPKPHPDVSPPGFFSPMHKSSDQTEHPLWKSPGGDYLTDSAVTFYKSNLYFFVDRCIVTNVSGHWTVAEKNGYHAELVCLSRDFSEPIVVPVKFDLESGQPPLKSLGEKMERISPEISATWMSFVGDALYVGHPNIPGIWTIPISEVETAIAVQKQTQLIKLVKKRTQAAAAEEQHRKDLEHHKDLLAKYDRNHNGIIDPEEKEEALDDPAFIEFELDAIDANQNGHLDPEELAWFDANQNKLLEPKEQAGIDIAQHLFAAKLLKRFDHNGDGLLDHSEFNELFQSGWGADRAARAVFSFPDRNHDGQVDLEELKSFLMQRTQRELRSHGMPPTALFNQMRPGANGPTDQRPLFKAAVESYWQNSGGVTSGMQNSRPQ